MKTGNQSIDFGIGDVDLHQDFLSLNRTVLNPLRLTPKNIQVDKESQEYGALSFDLDGRKIKFRVGKTTPTKVGHFVTLWKRVGGVTVPHDSTDGIDFFVIGTRNKENIGFFLFSKEVLIHKTIFSNNGTGGKRGIRVYSPWVLTTSKLAKSTQIWQEKYFCDFSSPVSGTANFKAIWNKGE
ncbi:MAG: MepB family protein [Oligoflexales bacterium]